MKPEIKLHNLYVSWKVANVDRRLDLDHLIWPKWDIGKYSRDWLGNETLDRLYHRKDLLHGLF